MAGGQGKIVGRPQGEGEQAGLMSRLSSGIQSVTGQGGNPNAAPIPAPPYAPAGVQEQPPMAMPQPVMDKMQQRHQVNPQMMAIMQQMMAQRQQRQQPRSMLGNPDMLRHLRGN